MARKVFYSFHFDNDHWRVSQVKEMGSLEGNAELAKNDWEAVKRGGAPAIERWINDQMLGKSCAVVLVGAETAERPWVKYEIKKAWEEKKGVVGIRIHRLLNNARPPQASYAGNNPFSAFTIGSNPMLSIAALYDPPGLDSKAVYASIRDNIADLVEKAIAARARY